MAGERNALGLTVEEVEKELKLLENQYKMYEKTKKETERTMKSKTDEQGKKLYTKEKIDKQLELIQNAQDDTIEKYQMLGGDVNDLKKLSKRRVSRDSEGQNYLDIVKPVDVDTNDKLTEISYAIENSEDSLFTIPVIESASDNGFDLIPLPSKGLCYRNKMGKVPVAPLCANDENMIISPNLYKENLILDYILKAKVLNNEIDPQDMLEGDREAILLYLRRDGYGSEYPITAIDDKTGKKFDTVIDLSKLTYKKFNLESDVNGWFPFKLPKSGADIKFRFLTHRDNVRIEKAEELESKKLIKDRASEYLERLDSMIDMDDTSDANEKTKVRQAIRTLEAWRDNLEDSDILYNHTMTNKLELSVMSINGNTDRGYIRDFVRKMNVRDSLALRKYILDNEPGVNYSFTIEKPESLGGGSMEVFLQFDKFIFLNVA